MERTQGWRLVVVCQVFLFVRFLDFHVVKLFGVKDFATLQAFDKLSVLMPGDDSYPGVFAGCCHGIVIWMNLGALPADCSQLLQFFKRNFARGSLRGKPGNSNPAKRFPGWA